MKRTFIILIMLTICSIMMAQEITVRFTGQLNGNEYCRLDSVAVTNITHNWSEFVAYPDTIIVLGSTVNANLNPTVLQGLGQNIPNPFDCETRVELAVSQREDVSMQLLDAAGKLYATYNGMLDAGMHIFDISAANPQTYLLNAMVGSHQYSIRMVNVGSGCGCSIKYAGSSNGIEAKLTTTNEFQIGDNMRYVGYASIDGQSFTSTAVEQVQYVSQYVTLQFVRNERPVVQTLAATEITSYFANLNGIVVSDGGATITARGFFYGTSSDNMSNNVTVSAGSGEFASAIENLSAGTTYYYCAYATNEIGTTMGEVLNFTTVQTTSPTVATLDATNVAYTTATLNGSLTSTGGLEITEKGFFYGTSDDNLSQMANASTDFSAELSGLDASTTYYFKAFATNANGTSYGEVKQFTTECNCGGSVTVTDYDGNTYGTVQIGEQCWMAQNLKTTHFADGTSIAAGASTSTTTAYRCNPNNNSSNVATYGYLYNWPAAMHGANSSNSNPSNVQGVCPNGWHLPSDAEWTQLTDYLSSQSEYQCGGTTANIAKSLASTTGWSSSTNTCAVGNTPANNNSTGFGALPAGYYNGSYGLYGGFGDGATFWSATKYNSDYAYYRCIAYNYAYVDRYYRNKGNGVSVRCVRDYELPTVTTISATSISSTGAIISGGVNATVTERGFMYGTNADNLTQTVQCGSGTGNFTANLTGLSAGTTYYYKAYATNSVGTGYGEVLSFTTEAATGTGTLNGHDWVDLGLPSGTRWATCNVGASTPTDYGNYYAWGETTTKGTYKWSTYQYCNGSSSTLTKYCNNSSFGNNGFTDALTTLESSDDAATANWGSGWRMPTKEEFEELNSNCTTTWTTQGGVNGRLFTGPNGSSIFLPAAGYRRDSELLNAGSYGYYRSSSLYTDNPSLAWYLSFNSGNCGMWGYYRYYGLTVRPVLAE